MFRGGDLKPLGDRLSGCLLAATLAPSVYNSQPWLLHVTPEHIEVSLDPSRHLPLTDLTGRDAWISVGAAILNLRIALLGIGRLPHTTLLPEPYDPNLAARITFRAPREIDPAVRALASAISRRHTNRLPFRDIPVRSEVIEQLIVAARVEGAHLVGAFGSDRLNILALVRSANESHTPSGLAADAPGPTDLGEHRGHPMYENSPTVLVLYTCGDGPEHWLRAGQAMQRVLLTATIHGVASTPLSAPANLPDLRELLGGPPDTNVAQMVLRLGYADPVPAAARRPLIEVRARNTPSPALR